jgi:hypothetical protein
MDYNAINFKNKDIDRFSTSFGNGDPKKKKGDSPDNTFSAPPTLPKFETVAPKSTEKDWREKSRVGALIGGTPYVADKDKGGKKNMNMGGNKSKICVDKPGQKKQDKDCRNPNAK